MLIQLHSRPPPPTPTPHAPTCKCMHCFPPWWPWYKSNYLLWNRCKIPIFRTRGSNIPAILSETLALSFHLYFLLHVRRIEFPTHLSSFTTPYQHQYKVNYRKLYAKHFSFTFFSGLGYWTTLASRQAARVISLAHPNDGHYFNSLTISLPHHDSSHYF